VRECTGTRESGADDEFVVHT